MILDTIKQQYNEDDKSSIKLKTTQSLLQQDYYLNSKQYLTYQISNKFKGMILLSILQKKPNDLKKIFCKWRVNVTDKYHTKIINKMVCPKGKYFCKESFYYRLRVYLKENNKQSSQDFKKIQVKKNYQKQNSQRQFYQPNEIQRKQKRQSSIVNYIRRVSIDYSKNNAFNIKNQSIEDIQKQQFKSRRIFEKLQDQSFENTQKNDNNKSKMTIMASLKSIIDQKVLKKKTQKSIGQNKKKLLRDNSTSVCQFHSIIQSQFNDDNQSIHDHQSLPKFIQKKLKAMKEKKNIKISDTISLIKQISTVYLQSCLINKIKRFKIWSWTMLIKLKPKSVDQLAYLQRQYQLIEQNLQKQQQIISLTNQIQIRVSQIQQIQQQIQSISLKITKTTINQFLYKINKIIKCQYQLVFQSLKSYNSNSTDNILPNDPTYFSEYILQKSDNSFRLECQGLNSIKQIMDENNFQ